MRPVNQEHARRDGLVVYLEADAGELWRRIEADPASAATLQRICDLALAERTVDVSRIPTIAAHTG